MLAVGCWPGASETVLYGRSGVPGKANAAQTACFFSPSLTAESYGDLWGLWGGAAFREGSGKLRAGLLAIPALIFFFLRRRLLPCAMYLAHPSSQFEQDPQSSSAPYAPG